MRQKIIFADQLRCFAAIAVVFVHLCGGYWAWRDQVAARIMAPILEGPNSLQLSVVSSFDFGPFGVSLFFLISGFVIPFSLEKITSGRFLLARAFRIYPTYIACLAVGIGVSFLSSRYWGQPFGFTGSEILSNALLINNITGDRSFDLVNWTLSIEIKFYIVMAALAAITLHRRVFSFFIVAALIILATHFSPVDSYGARLLRDLAFVPYMMIGTIFNLHMRGRLSNRQAFASIVALALAFQYTSLQWSLRGVNFGIVSDVYLTNIAVFAVAYIARDQFRPNRIIDFVASISYPLYAVHPVVGYASLRLLMSFGLPPLVALSVTVPVAVLIAYGVHRLIERPSTDLGKRLAAASVPVAWRGSAAKVGYSGEQAGANGSIALTAPVVNATHDLMLTASKP